MQADVAAPRGAPFQREQEVRARIFAGLRLLGFIAGVWALIRLSEWMFGATLSGIDGTTMYLVREVVQLLIFLFVTWVMGRVEGKSIGDFGLPWRRMFGVQFWVGMASGFLAVSGLIFGLRAIGVLKIVSIALKDSEILKWGTVWILVFILVAVFEEFRARGYALFAGARVFGFWPAAVLSSAFFAYRHIGNQGEDWIGILNAFGFGMLACFLVRRTGTLWLAIGLHTSFDWTETYFYGVPDSGQTLPGHLLNVTVSGPAFLSGGTVGPEGSVLSTAMLLAA
jgi:membrane protease YdiL (CAAX protease family)